MIAAHLLDAYRAAAGDPDEDELRARAIAALRAASQRAAGLGAPESGCAVAADRGRDRHRPEASAPS